MSHKPSIFNELDPGKPGYSSFDLSHEVKTTTEFGYLTPVFWKIAIPGDKFSGNAEVLTRVLPMTFPIMHRVNVHIHHFFVPMRLLTANWERFITMSDSGGLISEEHLQNQTLPYLNAVNYVHSGQPLDLQGLLLDYLGLPMLLIRDRMNQSGVTQTNVSALPVLAYTKIWYDWYRDENVQDLDWMLKRFWPSLATDKTFRTQLMDYLDGRPSFNPDVNFVNKVVSGCINLQHRNYEKDYFTTSLPWTQKGMPVTLPLGTAAPINWTGPGSVVPAIWHTSDQGLGNNPKSGSYWQLDGGATSATQYYSPNVTLPLNYYDPQSTVNVTLSQSVMNNLGGVADLQNATAANINSLREAFQVQKFLEKNARNGSRYIEFIFSHFGVKVPDYRLNRSDYIGGGKSPLNISEVLSSVEDSDVPLGSYAGHGINYGQSAPFNTYCSEHGIIMSLLSIMPRTSYCDGVRREFLVSSPEDFPFPVFSHLGEQPVYTVELCHYNGFDLNAKDNLPVFGYQSRYSEYRSHIDSVTGQFRDVGQTGLSDWHLAQRFSGQQEINGDMIMCTPAKHNHIFPSISSDYHHFLCQLLFKITAVRPLPFDSAPGLIDHF